MYALVVDNQVMYVGKCQSLAPRFNLGYGQISPKNYYVGWQSTNCKVNHLVLKTVSRGGSVQLWFHETDDETAVEGQLITAFPPPWSGALTL